MLNGSVFRGALGLTNGLVITRLRVNPFIATLGMMTVAHGLTELLASGLQGTIASNVPLCDEGVSFLGSGYLLQDTFLARGIPFPVILMVILVILFTLFLRYTVLGRQIYAVGTNEMAARLSGVSASQDLFPVGTRPASFSHGRSGLPAPASERVGCEAACPLKGRGKPSAKAGAPSACLRTPVEPLERSARRMRPEIRMHP